MGEAIEISTDLPRRAGTRNPDHWRLRSAGLLRLTRRDDWAKNRRETIEWVLGTGDPGESGTLKRRWRHAAVRF
jgi:hypothetical protein